MPEYQKTGPKEHNALSIADARLDWGPKMLGLTEQQRLFVVELSSPECLTYTDAAFRAGYSANSEVALRVIASRMANNPKILEALEEYVTARIKMSSGIYLNALEAIALDPQNRNSARAASNLLDRAGHGAVQRIEKKVLTEVLLTEGQELERIKLLAQEAGIPLSDLLGQRQAAKVIEAEYVEVGEPSAVGLEDIL